MNKTAVVIGYQGAIGKQLVEALVNVDYKIIGVGRTGDIACDLTDYDQISRAVKQTKEEVETIDLLVNIAGVATYKDLVAVTDKEIQDAYMVNAIAPTIFMRDLIELMQHDGALVLNIGSGSGVIPMRNRTIYCATKFALRGQSLSLSEEYKDKNPDFCLITLGSTLTDFGTMSVEEKKKAAESGKAYFPVEFVVNKLIEIITAKTRESEVVLYPSDYGFGDWKRP